MCGKGQSSKRRCAERGAQWLRQNELVMKVSEHPPKLELEGWQCRSHQTRKRYRNAKPSIIPVQVMPNPRRGVKQAPSHAYLSCKERALWHLAAFGSVNGASVRRAGSSFHCTDMFISLHRHVHFIAQGENIPPAHLVNGAAVLRRASSSFNSQTNWFKERAYSTCAEYSTCASCEWSSCT